MDKLIVIRLKQCCGLKKLKPSLRFVIQNNTILNKGKHLQFGFEAIKKNEISGAMSVYHATTRWLVRKNRTAVTSNVKQSILLQKSNELQCVSNSIFSALLLVLICVKTTLREICIDLLSFILYSR